MHFDASGTRSIWHQDTCHVIWLNELPYSLSATSTLLFRIDTLIRSGAIGAQDLQMWGRKMKMCTARCSCMSACLGSIQDLVRTRISKTTLLPASCFRKLLNSARCFLVVLVFIARTHQQLMEYESALYINKKWSLYLLTQLWYSRQWLSTSHFCRTFYRLVNNVWLFPFSGGTSRIDGKCIQGKVYQPSPA